MLDGLRGLPGRRRPADVPGRQRLLLGDLAHPERSARDRGPARAGGTRVWESEPGELHQASTGEQGGLWRHRGRPPQALAGVGFTAQGFDASLPYRLTDAARDPRRRVHPARASTWEACSAAPGRCWAAPAGFEIDRADAGARHAGARACWSRRPAASATSTRASSRTSRRRTRSRAARSASGALRHRVLRDGRRRRGVLGRLDRLVRRAARCRTRRPRSAA